MNTLSIDTHKFVRMLRDKGVSEEQAEAIVQVVTEVSEAHSNNVASKEDLKFEIAQVMLKIEACKNELLKWIVPLILGIYALVAFKIF